MYAQQLLKCTFIFTLLISFAYLVHLWKLHASGAQKAQLDAHIDMHSAPVHMFTQGWYMM